MTSELPGPRRTGPQVRVEKADAQAMELAPVIAQIRASGARTLQAVADELNARGIPAVSAEKARDRGAAERASGGHRMPGGAGVRQISAGGTFAVQRSSTCASA
jgi:hypothetical protein